MDFARRAPSAGHTQGRAWVVLEGRSRELFWEHEDRALAPPGVLRAPVIVLPLVSRAAYLERYSRPDKAGVGRAGAEGWPVPYWLVDGGMALQLLLLAAVEEGLGALLFSLHSDPRALLSALGVPAGWEALGAVALGRPAQGWRPRARERPALAEVLHRGGW